jgi:acetyltransferase-like isoleucine patch superfamily enzyme
MIIKMVKALVTEAKSRGLIFTILMNLSNFFACIRGSLNALLFIRNIRSTIFFLQANSHIEIFHKKAKVHIGKFVFIRKNTSIRVDHTGDLVISDKVFINNNCTINCVNKITIGSQTKIAPNVCINDHDHNYKNTNNSHLIKGTVSIGKNVWIGANVVILRDTTIGDNAVIAAGSVVKGNVPANSLFVNKREKEVIPFGHEHIQTKVM